MTAVLRDAYGLPVSTGSRAAVGAYDHGVRALPGFGADTVEMFRPSVAADPDFALARGALAVALYLDEQIPAGRAELERAAALGTAQAATLTARERGRIPIAIASDLQDSVSRRRDELAVPLLERHLAKRPHPGHFWERARPS